MCGIVGVWAAPGAAAESFGVLDRMTDALARRGPDARGVWTDPDVGLGLGHRRLSILDVTAAGDQPMVSASGRYVLVFNGEIYNFRELRERVGETSPIAWRSGSDTEVMLAAFERWGVEAAAAELIGMFAFAVWDREARRLQLGRDRLGVKPLAVARFPGGLAFASDLFALLEHPRVSRAIDRAAVSEMIVTGCVPGERTALEAVQRVRPGTIVSIDAPVGSAPREHVYWDLTTAAAGAAARPIASLDEAERLVEAAVDRAVADRLVADVPLGAFLSGGVDSSLVVSSMVRAASGAVRTFSLGQRDQAYDEAAHAEKVAAALGTSHQTLVADEPAVLDAAQTMAEVYDEPFADSSQIATYLIARLARTEVKVALSGDGGDELFFGYNRYAWAPRVWAVARRTPKAVRQGMARVGALVGVERLDRAHGALGGLAPPVRLPGRQAVKLLHALACDSPRALYEYLRSVSPVSASLLRCSPAALAGADLGASDDLAEAMRLADLRRYLPDDVMTKVDRATMAAGLEAREPLLDHRLVELALAIPRTIHFAGGEPKALLRRILRRRVPAALIDRPKMGFAVPIARWLRGPLRPWARDLLASRCLDDDGIVDRAAVDRLFAAHEAGGSDHADALWPVVMYAAWRRRLGA